MMNSITAVITARLDFFTIKVLPSKNTSFYFPLKLLKYKSQGLSSLYCSSTSNLVIVILW